MIDKKKLKEFLSSDYSTNTKLFVVNALKGINDNPSENAYLSLYLYELDLFEEGFIRKPDETFYLIDFYYLEKLNSEIRDFYIDILMDGISGDPSLGISFAVQKTSFLIQHGILISDLEYLKIKRKQKLEEVEAKKLIDDDDLIGDDDDFFSLDDD